MSLSIQGIKLNRLIVHEALLRGDIESGTKPQRSDEITYFDDPNAVKAIGKRLSDALGSDSHAVDLSIENDKVGSVFDELSQMLDGDDESFTERSKSIADALSRAQSAGNIKPGIIVLLDGDLGEPDDRKRFIAVIKAENDTGFLRTKGKKGIILRFVRDLVLSAQQRLFKIGFFIENHRNRVAKGTVRSKEEFDVIVYDHQMSVQGSTNAAQYFYGVFLGCHLTDNAARLNRIFFETASEYFKDPKLKLSNQEKTEKRTHLVSYMTNQSAKISGKEFAQLGLKPEHQDGLIKQLKAAGFPDRAVIKDTSQIKRRLTMRRMTFSSDIGSVRIFAPESHFQNLVKIGDSVGEWTSLKVKGKLEGLG